MRNFYAVILFAGWFLANLVASAQTEPTPPKIAREFRGMWITSVWNVDWPSKAGLSTQQQKSELLAIFDRAAQLKMNAVVLQVRPACDAFYASPYEPWSQFLTGTMGKAPSPYYDPLQFAVQEAHKRGLELHAWFNPFRARVSDKVTVSANHVSKRMPQSVRQHGKYLWLDPGDVIARDYSLKVILDVVRRYDIDGVQIDDYFYPSDGKPAKDFDDNISWQRYVRAGGKMNRDDWRRENINIFIQRLYGGIKTQKRWVKFGISPPGIWRSGVPPQIKGRDVYSAIYADSRKWLASGWCDYFSPQLYWKIDPPQQSYPVLLKWWTQQNVRGRHLWPGLGTGNVASQWPVSEILNQISITRQQPGATGHIHYHAKSVTQNPKGLATELAKIYDEPALVPASPWLNNTPPTKPTISINKSQSGMLLSWKGSSQVWQWVLQKRVGNDWTTEILSSSQTVRTIKNSEPKPDLIAVTAVSRYGIASAPAVSSLK